MINPQKNGNFFIWNNYHYFIPFFLFLVDSHDTELSNVSFHQPYTSQYSQVQAPMNGSSILSSLGCSVFNLLCCFFWLGIPAIIFSVKAKDKFRAGQLEEAKSDARIAKILNTIGVCIGSVYLLIIITYLIRYYNYYNSLSQTYSSG